MSQQAGPPRAPSRPARCIMVLGTSSSAGKSWVTTALCRYYANLGLRVAPFKAQNMSGNVRLVPGADDGFRQLSSAQYFQCLAARATPDVRMSPVILKPHSDVHSQVLLLGQTDHSLAQLPWRERSSRVWPHISQALDDLRADHDLVIIEGAGSPAEINLYSSDVVNMRVARQAQARCLLVTDIDRGGAFAHLYGTWALLPSEDRQHIAGFVLNKFRGDVTLLAPAPSMLQELTGVPVLATIPMHEAVRLPEEDGIHPASHEGQAGPAAASSGEIAQRIAIIATPRAHQLDEFHELCAAPTVNVSWVRHPEQVKAAKLIIIPGSASVHEDLAWLRNTDIDAAITAHARSGGQILALGSGVQILGNAIAGSGGVSSQGLRLLPLDSRLADTENTRVVTVQFPLLTGAWSQLSGIHLRGRMIDTVKISESGKTGQQGLQNRMVWHNPLGNVLGVLAHGLFEDAGVLQRCFAAAKTDLDRVFDELAGVIAQTFSAEDLQQLIDHQPGKSPA